MRELIWQYPMAFAITVCVGAATICAIGVVACFSISPNKDDGE